MKKIVALISSLVLCFSLCCVNVFAAAPQSVSFPDAFKVYEFIPFGLSSSQYTTTVNSVGTGTNIMPSSDGVFPDSFAYSFRVSALASDGFIPNDYNISGTFNFELILPISSPAELKTSSLLLYDVSTQNFWGLTYKTKFSDVQFLEKIETYDYGTKWRCSADFSYTNNTGKAINADNVSFQFYFALPDTARVPAEYIVAVFSMSVDNYFFGSSSDPNAPVYGGYEDLNDDISNNGNLEDEILENNQQGIEEYNASIQGLNILLEGFDDALLAFSRLFEYIIYKFDWLYAILSFGLALGGVSFVLNLYNSIRRRS